MSRTTEEEMGTLEKTSWLKSFRNKLEHWKNCIYLMEGIVIDVEFGIREYGEEDSHDYWNRVWQQIYWDSLPDDLPYQFLKDEWKASADSGRTCCDVLFKWENKYPGPFIFLPLMNRWLLIGYTKSLSNYKMFDNLDHFSDLLLKVGDNPELREKLSKMRTEGKENEFWKEHWDEVHNWKATKQLLQTTWLGKELDERYKPYDSLLTRRSMDDGKMIWKAAIYESYYPAGYKRTVQIRDYMEAIVNHTFQQFSFD